MVQKINPHPAPGCNRSPLLCIFKRCISWECSVHFFRGPWLIPWRNNRSGLWHFLAILVLDTLQTYRVIQNWVTFFRRAKIRKNKLDNQKIITLCEITSFFKTRSRKCKIDNGTPWSSWESIILHFSISKHSMYWGGYFFLICLRKTKHFET